MTDPEEIKRKLSQALVMTPQLQMAIRLLALPLTDLVKELPQLLSGTHAELRARIVMAPGPFSGDANEEPYPEAYVWRDQDGTVHVEANEVPLPEIVVVRRPVDLSMKPQVEGDEEADPLDAYTGEEREAARSSMWTVRAIRQRGRTYAKVVSALAASSNYFFDPEADPKVPVRDLALAVGMHESTVSRVLTGEKLVRCERGLVRLDAFVARKKQRRKR